MSLRDCITFLLLSIHLNRNLCVCVWVCVFVGVCVWVCGCVCVCVSGKCAYSDIQTFNQDTNHDKHRNYLSNFNSIETGSTENIDNFGRRDAMPWLAHTPAVHFRSIDLRTNDTPSLYLLAMIRVVMDEIYIIKQ